MATPADQGTPSSATREDDQLDGGPASKKRRTGPNSRGVANLTPEQLARKRANDREAQRAIRERTKNQIDRLQQRIRDLESQQPYHDLQVVLRDKEAVQAENADIRKRLESVLSIIQPIVRASGGLNGMSMASWIAIDAKADMWLQNWQQQLSDRPFLFPLQLNINIHSHTARRQRFQPSTLVTITPR